MLARIRKSAQEKDQGFTLIELLVVIIIIGILAAIAIPVFLRQREKGWDAQAKSDLKNMATAEETWLTDNNVYTSVEADLVTAGFKPSANVGSHVPVGTAGSSYSMTVCAQSGHAFTYTSATGVPTQTGTCTFTAGT
jgi:type IV pilus assembly protein PilA